MLLGPYQSMLYTWEDPTAERQLLWNAYNSKAVDIPAMIEKVRGAAAAALRADGSWTRISNVGTLV